MRPGGRCPKSTNRSPKGNVWSAIPVALLCMIVNLSEGKQGSAAAPKGTKSCRTQGDFCSSICLFIRPSVWAEFRSKRADVRPFNANRKLERANLKLERNKLRLR